MEGEDSRTQLAKTTRNSSTFNTLTSPDTTMPGTDSPILSTTGDLQAAKYDNLEVAQQWPPAITSTTDSYLVIMKSDSEGINQGQRNKHLATVQKLCSDKKDSRSGIQVGPKDLDQLYSGYMGIFPADIVATIRNAPEVKSVVRNSTKKAKLSVDWSQSMPTIRPDEYWKISHDIPPVWTTRFESRGTNANVFVLDLGGFAGDDFKLKPDRVRMQTITGTKEAHCNVMANCIAGETVGIAKDALIYPLAREETFCYDQKVMNWLCGFQTELRARNQNKTPLSILNCSWAYDDVDTARDTATNEALNKLHNAGVAVFKAAGNESANLDDLDVLSPVQAQMKWRSIGSVDKNRRLAKHSNVGQRVSLFAPGEGVKCYPGLEKTENGTSCATAFVSGFAACLATDYNLTRPEDIYNMLDSLKIWSDSYKGIVASTGELGPVRRLEIVGPSQCARDVIFWPLTLLEQKKVQNGVDYTVKNQNLWSARAPTKETGFSNKSISLPTEALRALGTRLVSKPTPTAAEFDVLWKSHFGVDLSPVANTINDLYVGTKRLALSAQPRKGTVKDNFVVIGEFILAQIDAAIKDKIAP